MGACILLYIYAKDKGKDNIYTLYADTLIDEIWGNISKGDPVNFSDGLSGIAWGIDYLIQNNYLDGDSLEICEEIDSKLMQYNILRIKDTTIDFGIEGFLHYILIHLKVCLFKQNDLPFDNYYLDDVYGKCTSIINNTENTDTLKQLANNYISFYKDKKMDYVVDLNFKSTNNEIPKYSVGLLSPLLKEIIK